MGNLIKNYRKSIDEVEGGKYADTSPSELVYNIITEVEELRNLTQEKENIKETEEKLLEKIKLLQSEVINLEKENDSKNEKLRNFT